MKTLKFGEQFHRTELGFTLIEILIAVAISAMLLGVLFTSFFQILKAKDRVETDLSLLHESRVIFQKLNRDLSSVFPRGRVFNSSKNYPYSYFKGGLDGENSNLRFSSFSRFPLQFNRESDQSEISYFLVESTDEDDREREDEKIYSLVRRDNPWFGNTEGGIEYEISERVLSFRINYIPDQLGSRLSRDESGFEEEKINEWDAQLLNSLPAAIEVEIVLKNENGEDQIYIAKILLPTIN